jgi:ABC-type antimicrobial peptide transport system permease subunit
MILTGILLYSLMLSDVDSKTYEYGMLRALGFKSSHLIGMISIQSFIFSVPGVALGLIVAWIFNVLFRLVIFNLAQNAASFALSTASIWLGVSFGLIMPLLSILIPIK